jgi:hypothetical protein
MVAAMRHRLYLVPGFFGFANFGDFKYFAHVRDQLERAASERAVDVDIHYVATLPTASLPRRAARLLEVVAETAGDSDDLIHLIGHSTGGIDARLLASPGVTLPTRHAPDSLGARIRTVVAIASPHYGTPQAALFTSMFGQRLLRVLSLMTLHGIRLGSTPISAVAAVASMLPRAGRTQGPLLGILDQVYRQLLRDFDRERRDKIEEFFTAASAEQGLLPQLSPEAMEVFNAAVSRRPGTRYGCVIARGRPPSWRTSIAIGLSPQTQVMYALYRALYQLAAAELSAPALTHAQATALQAAYGSLPSARDNDAIVPTLSQVFGDVVHAAWADHLDVIGHFDDPQSHPPHIDWLTTQADFRRSCFDALWDAVADYVLT